MWNECVAWSVDRVLWPRHSCFIQSWPMAPAGIISCFQKLLRITSWSWSQHWEILVLYLFSIPMTCCKIWKQHGSIHSTASVWAVGCCVTFLFLAVMWLWQRGWWHMFGPAVTIWAGLSEVSGRDIWLLPTLHLPHPSAIVIYDNHQGIAHFHIHFTFYITGIV